MKNCNLELNLDEMGMLTAMVLSYAKKSRKWIIR